MSLSKVTRNSISDILRQTVRNKLKEYHPETENMPFHYRLLGKDRYAMFSFMQSMNTTFGISLWEQVAAVLATNAGNKAERQHKLLGEIDEATEKLISNLMLGLRKGEINPNIAESVEQIRRSIRHGQPKKDPDSVVDLFIVLDGVENYFDITTVKPNMKDFVALKHKLLRWAALRLSQSKETAVITRLAIPYNPYHPEPYERWTLRGLYDLSNGEILVGDEFWNFAAGCDCYEDLLDLFQEVGEELRTEIDSKFDEFKNL